jgi:hypothetical protein
MVLLGDSNTGNRLTDVTGQRGRIRGQGFPGRSELFSEGRQFLLVAQGGGHRLLRGRGTGGSRHIRG